MLISFYFHIITNYIFRARACIPPGYVFMFVGLWGCGVVGLGSCGIAGAKKKKEEAKNKL